MSLASKQAENKLQGILAETEKTMRAELGAELERLRELRKVNPSIRQEELDHLEFRRLEFLQKLPFHNEECGHQYE